MFGFVFWQNLMPSPSKNASFAFTFIASALFTGRVFQEPRNAVDPHGSRGGARVHLKVKKKTDIHISDSSKKKQQEKEGPRSTLLPGPDEATSRVGCQISAVRH